MRGLRRVEAGKRIGPGADQSEHKLARAIRAASARDRRVGDDVLSVVLPRPGASAGVVTFHAARDWPTAIVTPMRRFAVAHADHTPWLIAPHMIAPPSALVGEASYDLGGYGIVIRGAPGERGVLGLQTSLARPTLAALREQYAHQSGLQGAS